MKTAIVTGASGNLGSAVVKKFIKEGFFVAGTAFHKHTSPDGFSDSYENTIVNLEDENESEKFVEKIINQQATIDVAVLTAGGFEMGSVAATKSSDIEKQYKLNFQTVYNIARPVFSQMLKQGHGRIFFIGSKAGLSAEFGKGVVAYGLTKSLLFRLAELMNDEAKGKNVVISVVVPSTIDTPQNREGMPHAHFENWVKAESIANIIYWHCTEEASAIRQPVIKIYNNA